MTKKEFTDGFDLLYNNITSYQAPGLNAYEKSFFLTKAERELVKNRYNPKSNNKQEGFDDTAKRQYDFSTLIRYNNLLQVSTGLDKFDFRSKEFLWSDDMFIILNEQLADVETESISVVKPISFDEYDRLMQKPYKYPVKGQVWRLITNQGYSEQVTTNVSLCRTGDISRDSSPNLYTAWETYYANASNGRIICKSSKSYPVTVKIIADMELATVSDDVLFEDFFSASVEETRHPVLGYVTSAQLLLQIRCRYKESVGEELWDYTSLNLKQTLSYALNLDKIKDVVYTQLDSIDISNVSTYSLNGVFVASDDDAEYRVLIAEATTEVTANSGTVVELIGANLSDNLRYNVRFIKKPEPIILEDLPDGFSIEGKSSNTPCELPDETHDEILQRAVELAKVAWEGNMEATIQTGARSE